MKPKISIIVPVYNVEAYLDKCLNSLVNQTLKEIEIIVVNDGSKDNSELIIKKYKQKDKRIIYLKKENGGLSSARNYGYGKASGEYIGYVDSDDYVSNDMFEKMYNLAKQDNSDIVMCDFYKKYDNNTLIPISSMTIYTDDMKKNYVMSSHCAWNKIYKKNLLNDHYFIEGMLYEDLSSNPLLVAKINKISYLREPLYYYSIRDNSIMTNQKFNPKFYDILKSAEIVTNKIKKDTVYQPYLLEFEYLIIDNLLRDTYFRLKNIKESAPLLNDIVLFIKQNYPYFMKNKYIRQRGFKYRVITYFIYKKYYPLLTIISRKSGGKNEKK